ncbi:hypothetical protein [Streptomyces sp. NPDC056069]|uniref:hypothetical protein n=1 Tax=Streptomyces sp. NPDC056069 TaxID=3345702 RepID=UPI0035E2549C
MHTTATQLQTIARLWPDLEDALGTPNTIAGFGLGLRGYLATLEQYDPEELESRRWHAAHLRTLERNPDQLGTRPVPISLRILEVQRTVEAALHETATQIAAANQLGAHTSHPHRWSFTGQPPGAAWTALWLSARAEGRFWPGRALTGAQLQHLKNVAREALHRVETALDLARDVRELSPEHTCQCGGRIVITGGAGDQPTARCRGCGALWSERGVVAA